MNDEDVPGWWQRLGLPGLIDVHVHFMPDRVMSAVWDYFDAAQDHYGRAWPVHYRLPVAQRLERLEQLGVRAFPSLLYPHKPGMAQGLNTWAREFAAETDGCVSSGTFFPEPGAADYVRAALEAGTRIFKAHVQVGGYDPRDPLLDDVWGMLAEAGVAVVVHCGDGPIPGPHTGPGPFEDVLRKHPRLTAVIAHLGAPEYSAFLRLPAEFPNVHLDTTMIGTPYFEHIAPLSADDIATMGQLQDRIVLGTDFPNIPYPYADQIAALDGWGLGESWLKDVCWTNGARLLQVAD